MPPPFAPKNADRSPEPLRVSLAASTPPVRSIVRVVVIALLLFFIAGFVQSIISSLTLLFFLIVLSVFFAYLLDPLVRLIREPFKRRGREKFMPRPAAIAIAYVIVFTVMGVAIANVAPRVADQARELSVNIPTYISAIRARTNEVNQRFERLRIPDDVQDEVNKKATEFGASVTASIGNFLLVSVSYLPWLLLIPILAFFFLKDVNQFRLLILRIFPAGRWRYRAEMVMADVNTTLAAYTRAQLISCVLIGVICTIAFYLLGLRYALLLGILAGVFEFVPLLGPLTISIVVTLTAVGSDNPWRALYVAIFLTILRIVHDYVTYPRIVQGGIHLHPLAIIMAVLAGEQVAGIPGVFLAIPIVALTTVIYRHVLEHQGSRGLFSGWFKDPQTSTSENK